MQPQDTPRRNLGVLYLPNGRVLVCTHVPSGVHDKAPLLRVGVKRESGSAARLGTKGAGRSEF